MMHGQKYKYRGGEITIAQAAQLAGVSKQAIHHRLKRNGGDMELAVLGINAVVELPEYEPDISKREAAGREAPTPDTDEKPAAEDHTVKFNALAALNELIKNLEAADDADLPDDTLRKLMRKELVKLRSLIYGRMVDWDDMARRMDHADH